MTSTLPLCGARPVFHGEEISGSVLSTAVTTPPPPALGEGTATPDEEQFGHLYGYLTMLLQAAIEVEHSTIPPYLTAMYTIEPGTNRTAYEVIRSVVLEEMLHMSLAANILTAVGGRPRTTYPDFCGYPACVPCRKPRMWIPLRHFSPEAVTTFLTIESPAGSAEDLDGYEHCDGWHGKDQWHSIREFYGLVEKTLTALVAMPGGEERVFGDVAEKERRYHRQVGPEHYYNGGGSLMRVYNLKTALQAVDCIVEQGEGLADGTFACDSRVFDGSVDVPHYFRFNEIRQGRYYNPGDLLTDPPNGEPMHVDWSRVRRIEVPAHRTGAACGTSHGDGHVPEHIGRGQRPVGVPAAVDGFNLHYSRLLVLLEHAFNGEAGAMERAIHVMLGLKYAAEGILRTPHPTAKGLHLHPTFAVDDRTLAAAKRWVADDALNQETPYRFPHGHDPRPGAPS
jgi:hypothetical protein